MTDMTSILGKWSWVQSRPKGAKLNPTVTVVYITGETQNSTSLRSMAQYWS